MSQSDLTSQQQKEVKKEVNKQLSQHFKILSKTEQTAIHLTSEFKKQTSTALIAAFGFIIALVWRDLIQKFFQENINPTRLAQYPYLAQLYSALIITLFAVIGIAILTKWSQKLEQKTNPTS